VNDTTLTGRRRRFRRTLMTALHGTRRTRLR